MSSSIEKIPPTEIPIEYASEFTMNHEIPVLNWYFNNTLNTSIVWDDKVMSDMLAITTYENIITNGAKIDCYDAGKNIMVGLQKIDNLSNKSVAVIGSLEPWIECICMNNGITDITTPKKHIEIKEYTMWKHALGQILAYDYYDPKEKLEVHLFGEYPPEKKEIAKAVFDKYNITIVEIID